MNEINGAKLNIQCLRVLVVFGHWFAIGAAISQPLPSPSRTAFKCEVDGKVSYADAPCLGAKKVDLEPTRGLNADSGKERLGRDVQRERQREMFAEGVRPLTGMDAKQFDRFGRRMNLSPEHRQECLRLDREIPVVEASEKSSSKESLRTVQAKLLGLRRVYLELRC
jgi:hypothetical protein